MNIRKQSLDSNVTCPSDFVEGCKQMSAESCYAFRKILREKFNITESYLNECTKEFTQLILT